MTNIKDIDHVSYRNLCFTVNDFFLSSSDELNADINYFIQCPVNYNNSLEPFYTLLIDLREPENVIWKNIYHRTQSEINSFLNNQVFEHKVHWPLDNNELDHFINLYNDFAQFKNIRRAETQRLKAYNKNNLLAITYLKQDNRFLWINFYRVTKQRATNLYSFNLKHDKNNTYNSTHLGRAHRTLHWLDILEFKKTGINYYDLCGWYDGTENKELLNVNKFKEQFSTNKIKEYTGVIYKNPILKFLKKFRHG